MRVLKQAELNAPAAQAWTAPQGIVFFDYDDNLISERETLARMLDTRRDLTLSDIFAAR